MFNVFSCTCCTGPVQPGTRLTARIQIKRKGKERGRKGQTAMNGKQGQQYGKQGDAGRKEQTTVNGFENKHVLTVHSRWTAAEGRLARGP
eukprot:1158576-Pelagomonas_calceolata.AAC.2